MQTKLNYSKTVFCTLAMAIVSTTSSLLAEGKGKNGFAAAAEKYDRMSSEAHIKGDLEAAKILSRLADIKRKAAGGTLKNWDQYHELSRMLQNTKSQKSGKDSYDKGMKNKTKKGISSYKDRNKSSKKSNKKEDFKDKPTLWNGAKKGKTKSKKLSPQMQKRASKTLKDQLNKHRQQADQSLLSGDFRTANIHTRLVQILETAAVSAQAGSTPELSEYFSVLEELFDFTPSPESVSEEKG